MENGGRSLLAMRYLMRIGLFHPQFCKFSPHLE